MTPIELIRERVERAERSAFIWDRFDIKELRAALSEIDRLQSERERLKPLLELAEQLPEILIAHCKPQQLYALRALDEQSDDYWWLTATAKRSGVLTGEEAAKRLTLVMEIAAAVSALKPVLREMAEKAK